MITPRPGSGRLEAVQAARVALVIIDGNDVTSRSRIAHSSALLANQVTRLTETGATVLLAPLCVAAGLVPGSVTIAA